MQELSRVGAKMRKLAQRALFVLLIAGSVAPEASAELGSFQGYEIRVIRPRFMTKRNRVELGAQLLLIMNQSFIYTFLASGILDYHFSEMFALELSGAYGFSIDKEDKRILEDEFDIKTSILRTQYLAAGGLIWTPIYGKTQLPSGDMVYFDSFGVVQAGMTGIEYTYEQCVVPPADSAGAASGENNTTKPPAKTVSYPSLSIGVGQKYFLTRSFGLRWDVRDYLFQYNKADGACEAGSVSGSGFAQNITLQFGASTFF